MWNSFKNWYKGEDLKYLYRLNRISLQEASEKLLGRQLLTLVTTGAIIALVLTQS